MDRYEFKQTAELAKKHIQRGFNALRQEPNGQNRLIDNGGLEERISSLARDTQVQAWIEHAPNFAAQAPDNAFNDEIPHLLFENIIFEEELSDSFFMELFKQHKLEIKIILFKNCRFEKNYHFDKEGLEVLFWGCRFNVSLGLSFQRINLSVKNFSYEHVSNFSLSRIVHVIEINNVTFKDELPPLFQEVQHLHLTNTRFLKNTSARVQKYILLYNVISNSTLEISAPEIDILACAELRDIVVRGHVKTLRIEEGSDIEQLSTANSIGLLNASNSIFGRIHISGDFPVARDSLVFQNCTFKKAPNFLSAGDFPDHTSFDNCQFQDVSNADAVTRYKSMRLKAHNIGDEHLASLFQAYEFESRYNTFLKKDKKWWEREWWDVERISSWCLKYANDYGRDLWKPLRIIAIIALVFAIFYTLMESFGGGGINCAARPQVMQSLEFTWVGGLCNSSSSIMAKSLAFSVNHSFGPIGLLFNSDIFQPANPFIKLIEFLQVLVTSILWFLFITALRRRFKV